MRDDLTWQQKLWIWAATIWRAGKALALYILMPAACMAFGYVLWHSDMSAAEFFTYGGNFYTALGMFLTLYLLHRASKKRGHRFFEDATLYMDHAQWKKCLGLFAFGVSTAVTISAVLTLLPRWGITEDYSTASRTMFLGRDILFTVVTTVLTGPLVEEVVFRGYMLNTLLEVFSEKWAVVIVSAIFAVCHGEALWILYAFGMGLLLAWVSIREDNILYGILLHIGFNLPSALVWLIGSIPVFSSVLFAGKGLAACYGLIGGLSSYLLWRAYRRNSWEERE